MACSNDTHCLALHWLICFSTASCPILRTRHHSTGRCRLCWCCVVCLKQFLNAPAVTGDGSFFSLHSGTESTDQTVRSVITTTKTMWAFSQDVSAVQRTATVQCSSYSVRHCSQCTGSCQRHTTCRIYDTENDNVVLLPSSDFQIGLLLSFRSD